MFQTKIIHFLKITGRKPGRSQVCRLSDLFYSQKRQLNVFINWFIGVFNGVDKKRLKLFGPDCTCAEWLLRNGASVRFKGYPTFLTDYQELIKLEETESATLKIKEIYAKEAGISCIGFEHLRGCNHVEKITLIFCSYIGNSALQKLIYVKDSLQYLEVRSCFNIQDEGLKALHDLKNLKVLILADLVSVENKEECDVALRKALPQCQIEFDKDEKK